jgi:protein TonB
VRPQIEGERHGPEPDRVAVEAALPPLGAVKPAKAHNGPVPARSGLADAMLAGIVAIKPGKGGAEEPSQSAQAGELIGKLVLPPLGPAQRRRRIAFKVAAVASVLLHAASLGAFLNWHGAETGAIEQQSEAISVEIVESRTLEALQPKQIPEPAPALETIAPVEGKTDGSRLPVARSDPVSEPEVAVKEPIITPEALEEVKRKARQEVPGTVETPSVPVEGPAEMVPEPPKAKVAEADVEAKRKEEKKIEKKKATERAPRGGVTSKASAGKGAGGERASASSGSIMTYAAHVRARVAGNKPSGGGQRGTAWISFGVTTSGGLGYASVARSSGNSTLDQMALSAVRGSAPFPYPPPGATSAQLRFTIPFYFQ